MNDITELRRHLFETLKALRNPDNPMDIERARAVCEVAQVITNTAKVEIDYLRHTGTDAATGFIANTTKSITQPTATGNRTITQISNGATLTRHEMA